MGPMAVTGEPTRDSTPTGGERGHARRIVLIAYHFPPQVGVASDRAGSLVRWLPEFGWGVDVVTVADPAFPRNGRVTGQDDAVVVRTPALELSRWARSAWAGGEAARGAEPLALGALGTRARTWVREWLYLPDSRVGWIPWARRAAKRLLADSSRVPVVYSSSVPYSAHLAAWASLTPDTKWVAEFRDPWSEAHPFLRPRTSFRRGFDDRVHQMIVHRADRVVVTSERTAERLVRKVGIAPDRVVVVRNGYEPTPTVPTAVSVNTVSVLYAGSVAPGEDVRPVLEGLARARDGADLPLYLDVLGPEEPWRSAASQVGGVGSALRLRGMTSPATARLCMIASNANLLLNWHPAYEAILPGKAYEYLGAGRPILAGVHVDSELAGLLRAHGEARFVRGHDASDWARAFLDVSRQPHRGASGAGPQRPFGPSGLTRRSQAQRVAEMLDRLVGPA